MLRKDCSDLLNQRKQLHKMKRFLEYKINQRELNATVPENKPVKDAKKSEAKPVESSTNKADEEPQKKDKSDEETLTE